MSTLFPWSQAATGEEEGGVPDLQEQHVRMIKELNQQDAMDAGPEPVRREVGLEAEGAVGGGLQPRTRATSGNIPGAEVVAAERVNLDTRRRRSGRRRSSSLVRHDLQPHAGAAARRSPQLIYRQPRARGSEGDGDRRAERGFGKLLPWPIRAYTGFGLVIWGRRGEEKRRRVEKGQEREEWRRGVEGSGVVGRCGCGPGLWSLVMGP